ncbi:LysR family transcriptional regulator [Aquincola tertiaricarbonis]|uniref:LysR family transcriptional regulator n=1 Tax=Aquincola tertiaricarbonis TaxID=391953 RepID=UPI0006153D18|nr:LysR family transcriptional regulator [Aquincola tertiaricarbonis]
MNLEDLRTFVEVADAGSLTAAARRLGMAKAIVSRHLIRLESDLGVQLLARTTRGATLTEAGATFRDYAAKVISDLDTAREVILPNGQLRGRLRIAAPLSFGPTHLAPVIAALAREHPALHVQTCYSDRLVNLIDEGFDCAIRFGNATASSLLSTRIGPLHATLVASPAYIRLYGAPESPEQVLEHEAILQGTEAWHFVDGDQVITLNPRGRFKADNGVAITAAALEGLGIAMIPDGLIAEHLTSGALVPVMTRYPPPLFGMYVVRPPGQDPLRKVRVLIEHLVDHFGDRTCVSGPARN